MLYEHNSIDPKWQKRWEDAGIFHANDDDSREKFYVLVEFPYPSGEGLHVGHPRSYTALDVVARKRRMEGKNVLYPMGWDAFGLPAENHAIKTGTHPSVNTAANIATFKRQIQSLGISFDWSREINTTDPAYYKWTQWQFLQFFKAGPCYKAKMTINWCPKDKIGLANEEAIGGVCERCGTAVEKKEKDQWMIAMTKYADRLLEDLKTVDYLPKIKREQEEWIGRSEGAEIDFALKFTHDENANENRGPNGEKAAIRVFTTRPDTLFGATYLVLAPEHLWVQLATDDAHEVLSNKDEVKAYVESVKNRTEEERTNASKEKTGVELRGVVATNPATGEEIPMFIADYVLPQYGTGAIMAVPAHDERDFAFAKKYDLPIRDVVIPSVLDESNPPQEGKENTFRKIILAIVRDPKNGKYLCLKWKTQPWTTFITGGVEDGEDVIEAARREIIEETGYIDFKLVRPLGGMTESIFYAAHKGVNRRVHNQNILFELVSDTRAERSSDEEAQYDVTWMSPEEIAATKIQHGEFPIIWQRVLTSNDLYTGEGVLIGSGEFDGMTSEEARKKITKKFGQTKVTYRLRDWVFSRQRYWGEPIPLVHCEEECSPETKGWVAVPDEQLPVELPQVEKYEPTDNGESPLSVIPEFVNTKCPQCGGKGTRETDTMPNWAGSSWYFLRYVDPKNDQAFASKELLQKWMPVDLYNGGMEHATRHLLYARFWTKALYDLGHVPFSEFCQTRIAHGMINAEDGTKMSKSKGNVVNPDEIVKEFGADTLRVYELFIGAFDEVAPWSKNGVIGVRRFLDRLVRLVDKVGETESVEVTKAIHKTLKKVTEDIEKHSFNTAVAAFMGCLNEMQAAGSVSKSSFAIYLRMFVPFAPHVANELWEKIGMEGLVESQEWPVYDPALVVDDEITVGVQVNGKLRGNITVPAGATEDEMIAAAKQDANVAKYLTGEPKKVIVIKGKIVSFVI